MRNLRPFRDAWSHVCFAIRILPQQRLHSPLSVSRLLGGLA